MNRPSARHRGFSLIEVVVVIAVLSILASMAVPLAAKVIDQSRTEATRKQMEEMHKLIVGDPALGTSGYVGDMGRLPQNPPPPAPPQPLLMLNTQYTQPKPAPNATTPTFLGVRMGWWGTYVNSGFSKGAYLKDAWGTDYVYNSPGPGQITSRGPDRLPDSPPGSGDDITYPPGPVSINGKLIVNLYVWNGSVYSQNPKTAGCSVKFYYSNNGVQAFAPPVTTTTPPYYFGSNPVAGEITCPATGGVTACSSGLHAVWAQCTVPSTVTGQAVVFVPGNNQQAKLDLYLK